MQSIDTISKFFSLKDEDKEALKSICISKSYPPNSIIFYQGESPKNLIFLLDGYVGCYHSDDNYKDIFFHIFDFPGLIAEPFTIEQIPYNVNIITFTKAKVVFINYDKFKKLFLSKSEVSQALLKSLCKKIWNYSRFANREKHNDIMGKICYFILHHEELLNAISQQNIAFILNLTPQILSKYLKKLKDEKILEFKQNQWKILDKNRLKNYANILEGY
ncbi:Crp/Fnr family transcriptional regulator [Campylobacter geochelonis]|uniref:Crp/Fnr family transcriptional regulator n=1 Tax=Campylobacter geochelonis TaxID=1780362 RepID=UPI0007708EF8|nr:Crp/Fnr family transcriptional regulator [Campylobacter geochelonis]CZE50690.1 transcription regulator [Campylobacter geochelonis]